MGRRRSTTQRILRGTFGSALGGALVLLGAAQAHAGKFDRTLDFSVHGRGGTIELSDQRLHVGKDAPALVGRSHPRLTGQGRTWSTGLRGNLSIEGVRFGLGAGFMGAEDLRLEHDRLAGGRSFTRGRVWGLPFEGFVGYAFRSGEKVRPYLEAQAVVTVLMAQAELRDPQLGSLGRARMHASVLEVVGRVGVLIPMGEYFFLDAAVGRTMLGPGQWVASVGLGIPIPTANL